MDEKKEEKALTEAQEYFFQWVDKKAKINQVTVEERGYSTEIAVGFGVSALAGVGIAAFILGWFPVTWPAVVVIGLGTTSMIVAAGGIALTIKGIYDLSIDLKFKNLCKNYANNPKGFIKLFEKQYRACLFKQGCVKITKEGSREKVPIKLDFDDDDVKCLKFYLQKANSKVKEKAETEENGKKTKSVQRIYREKIFQLINEKIVVLTNKIKRRVESNIYFLHMKADDIETSSSSAASVELANSHAPNDSYREEETSLPNHADELARFSEEDETEEKSKSSNNASDIL